MAQRKRDEADKVFRQFFTDTELKVQQQIAASKHRYPPVNSQELKLANIVNSHCSWRFLVDIEKGSIQPVREGDARYPFTEEGGIETFLQCIHPRYVKPFLVCAAFTYQFISELEMELEEIMSYEYLVSVPVRFPDDTGYAWYRQTSTPICIGDNKTLILHTNAYSYEQDFNEFEYRLFQPAVLLNGKLYQPFKDALVNLLKLYVTASLTVSEKKVLRLYAGNYKLQAVASAMHTTAGTERARNNSIMKKLLLNTGYKFSSIAELAVFFRDNDMLE